MVNTTLIAFLVDVICSLLTQVGLILQKLTHRAVEAKSKHNSPQQDENYQSVETQELEYQEQNQHGLAYFTSQWFTGTACIFIGTVVHIFCLPWLDLTLVACNATLGIVFALILSVTVVKERFIWRYDFFALLCIITGCVTIVLNANKVEVTYTESEVLDLIFSLKSITFVTVALSLVFINNCLLNKLIKKLRQFETDVDKFVEQSSQFNLVSEDMTEILPPRESKRIIIPSSERQIDQPLIQQDTSEVERPARILIDAINDTSIEQMQKVSPDTLSLKRFIKVPMVMFVWSSSMQSAICVVMLKLAGELVQSGHGKNHKLLIIIMIIMLLMSAALQLHLVNCAMKYYDQLEAVPVYQTCLMIMWILSGLLVLDEKRYYSWLELLGFLGSITICCIGIKLLTMKTKMVKQEARIEGQRSRRDSLTSQNKESFVASGIQSRGDKTDLKSDQMGRQRSNSAAEEEATSSKSWVAVSQNFLPNLSPKNLASGTFVNHEFQFL